MSDALNEFSINMPMIGVPPMADVPAEACDVTASYALPPEVNSSESNHISVSCDGYPQVNSVPGSNMVSVDLVLNVSISNPMNGSYSSYKIVKRLSMDKCKLAHQAEVLTPFQVVEAEEDPVEVAKYMSEFYAAKRAREVAGLTESRGEKKFKVQFSFDDKEVEGKPKARASGTVEIKDVRDAAHARHVFDAHHAPKYKDRNVKITRATEIKD